MKILTAVLLVLFGFGSFTAVSAKQPERILVKINGSATAKGGIKIKFVELVEDSRCPTDTNCIWAGNAKIKVRITKNGRSKDLEMNTGLDPKEVFFAGYSFKLVGLTPQPRSDIRINRNGYVAKIEVQRSSNKEGT